MWFRPQFDDSFLHGSAEPDIILHTGKNQRKRIPRSKHPFCGFCGQEGGLQSVTYNCSRLRHVFEVEHLPTCRSCSWRQRWELFLFLALAVFAVSQGGAWIGLAICAALYGLKVLAYRPVVETRIRRGMGLVDKAP